ncbi:MAG: TIGR01777 family oxidoreductase, partial [Gammaproteobacteria bacterium]|nr:TIGR01777 family oxidoreductase [Gammaproteobacteria bacterium]
KLLISGSAIGFYGNRGDEVVDENSAPGTGFAAELCRQWEAMTEPARQAGIRVVNSRTGIVLSPNGGALKKMLLPFRLGIGGVLGSGRQYVSWVSIDDMVDMIKFIIKHDAISGPVNMVSPEPVTNYQLTKALGRTLHRPTIFPMPAFVTSLVFGEMADELLLASTRVKPAKMIAAGYPFHDTTLAHALDHLLH